MVCVFSNNVQLIPMSQISPKKRTQHLSLAYRDPLCNVFYVMKKAYTRE